MAETPVLSTGSIEGGRTDANRGWRMAIPLVDARIRRASLGFVSPLSVNVIFLIPGNILGSEFIGIRTGSFSKERLLLAVQVGLPESAAGDAEAALWDAVGESIDAAEIWARRRKRAENLDVLRDVYFAARRANENIGGESPEQV